MYRFVENIDLEIYEKFVYNHNKKHFMQSCHWGEVQKYKSFKPYYVGLYKDDILVAVSLLLEKKILGKFGYIYCPRGFILDYSDLALIKAFTDYIKTFTKEHKNFFFRIDPDIKLQCIDEDANAIEGDNNFELVNYLKSIGYKHKGFYKEFLGSQPRYTYRLKLDSDIDKVYSGFHSTTRKILNKKNQFELDIYKGSSEDVKDFYLTMENTGAERGIVQSSLEYYQNYFDILNKNNMSDVYIVKASISKLKEVYKKLITIHEDKREKIVKENVLADLNKKIDKLKLELEEINLIEEDELVLSSIMTAKYNDYVWTIHGGNNTKLKFLNANYLVYYQIIEDAVSEGKSMIDFFGTTGNPVKENSLYGIHLFKKRLGGEYTEFIGQFDFVTNKLLYFAYQLYIKIKR